MGKKQGLDQGFKGANAGVKKTGPLPSGGQKSPKFQAIAKSAPVGKSDAFMPAKGGHGSDQGLRTAHAPSSEGGALSHIKTHIK